jgi:hypothetical protein
MTGETISRGAVIDAVAAPSLGIMTSGAFTRVMLHRRCMARLAIRIASMIEAGHHSVVDGMAASACVPIVIIRVILGVAIGALSVWFMFVINITPITARVVTAAAILAVVVGRRLILVAGHTIFDSEPIMTELSIRPGVCIMTLLARARCVFAWPGVARFAV